MMNIPLAIDTLDITVLAFLILHMLVLRVSDTVRSSYRRSKVVASSQE